MPEPVSILGADPTHIHVAGAQQVGVAVPHEQLERIQITVTFRELARKRVPQRILLPLAETRLPPQFAPLIQPICRADAAVRAQRGA